MSKLTFNPTETTMLLQLVTKYLSRTMRLLVINNGETKMHVIIDNNVPPPDKTIVRQLKWPFRELKIGQSFLMSGVQYKSAMTDCLKFGKKFGRKFTAAIVDGVGNVRVWRIE